MADLIIDINAPETSLMSVDIQASTESPVIELSMSSGFEVDITSVQSMSIDIVSGSVKGDKGDKGDPGLPGSLDRPFTIAMAVALS